MRLESEKDREDGRKRECASDAATIDWEIEVAGHLVTRTSLSPVFIWLRVLKVLNY